MPKTPDTAIAIWGDNIIADFTATKFAPAYARYRDAEAEADTQLDTSVRTRLSAQIALGRVLYELGTHLKHGAWGPWCAKNLPHYSLGHCNKMKEYGKAEATEPGGAKRMMDERAETDRKRRVAVIEAAVEMNRLKLAPTVAGAAVIEAAAEMNRLKLAPTVAGAASETPVIDPAPVLGNEPPVDLTAMPKSNPTPAMTAPSPDAVMGVEPSVERSASDLGTFLGHLGPRALVIATINTLAQYTVAEAIAIWAFPPFRTLLQFAGWRVLVDHTEGAEPGALVATFDPERRAEWQASFSLADPVAAAA